MSDNNNENVVPVCCSVCQLNNSEDSTVKFVRYAEAGIALCTECINSMHQAVMSVEKSTPKEEDFIFKTPSSKEVYNFLNKHIINQENAKKHLSIAISQHYKRIKDPTIEKSNLLIVGPTGTGKTEMARAIAKFLNIPFVSTDATSLTTRGYIGEDVDSIVSRLLQSCDYNVKRAERGIIFIDEIDKLSKSQNSDSQIGTVAVQQELLKIMEGTTLRIEKGGKHKGGDSVFINTKNILFICAGSFVGLEEMINKKPTTPVGLLAKNVTDISPKSNWFDKLETKHLVSYGLIPEFLGRIPIVIQTLPLTKEDLTKIITEPENSIINQYKKLLKIDQVDAEFSPKFLDKIVTEALEKNLGARGIRKALEFHLKELFFNVEEYSGKKIIIDEKIHIIEGENVIPLVRQV